MLKVEIYTAMACPFCKRAVKLLSAKNINFEEIDVTLNSANRKALRNRANGRTTVPQVFINDDHIGGCEDVLRFDQAGDLDELLTVIP